MGKEKKGEKRRAILVAIVLAALVLAAVAFGVRDGWLGGAKVVLSEAYYGEFTDYQDLSVEKYEELVGKSDSFVLFVDQGGCETAERLRGFVKDWASEKEVKVQRIMFSEMKKTSLHEFVKYYPSVVVVEKGKVRAFLRADSDEDADIYNDYEKFKGWIEKYI